MILIKEIVICSICLVVAGVSAKSLRIAGGTAASISDFPHLVSFRTISNRHFCSGSILSRWYVLSAAHCFLDFQGNLHKISAYSGVTSSLNIEGDEHRIQFVYNHPLFSWNFLELQSPHDICVVKLKDRINYSSVQSKIKLPSRDIFDGNLAVVAGWGASFTDPDLISVPLLKAPVTIQTYVTCSSKFPLVIFSNQFCAYSAPGVKACAVDSGGSITSNGELYGIVSMTYKSFDGFPDVHTKVYSYLSFIRSVVGDTLND